MAVVLFVAVGIAGSIFVVERLNLDACTKWETNVCMAHQIGIAKENVRKREK
jgi:hypothetical protein